MDGPGGGCCIARYATGGVVYDASKFDRIMLGFRPIAPKPSSCGSCSGRSSPERKDEPYVRRTGRGRRRRAATSSTSSSDKTNKGSIGRKRQRQRKKETGGLSAAAVVTTLPLLPEEAEIKEEERSIQKRNNSGACSYYDSRSPAGGEDRGGFSVPTTWLSFKRRTTTGFVERRRVVETWVTVESVTDTWMVEGGGWLWGRTDEQKRMALMGDSCPGMISDGLGRVIWTNDKFREMVGGEEEEEVAVLLVVKDGTANMHEAFTCRVRVQYRMRGKEEKGSVTLPCDVCRMEGGGGFAWRLDVKAALSLGPRW